MPSYFLSLWINLPGTAAEERWNPAWKLRLPWIRSSRCFSALPQKEAAPPPLPLRRVDPSFRRYWHVFPVIHPLNCALSLSLTHLWIPWGQSLPLAAPIWCRRGNYSSSDCRGKGCHSRAGIAWPGWDERQTNILSITHLVTSKFHKITLAHG